MLTLIVLTAAAIAQADVPPVPGLCSAPVPTDRDTPGCYQTNQIDLTDAPAEIYWQIYQYPTEAAAATEARRHRWSAVTQAHSRNWLYVLGQASERVSNGVRRAVIGPLPVPAGVATAHFSEAVFPPGMQTRVHSHPGPEAFYVVDGEQCMETPRDKRVIPAGGTYVVEGGPHLQAAPKGRRNLVLVLLPKGQPFMSLGSGWRPTGFCSR